MSSSGAGSNHSGGLEPSTVCEVTMMELSGSSKGSKGAADEVPTATKSEQSGPPKTPEPKIKESLLDFTKRMNRISNLSRLIDMRKLAVTDVDALGCRLVEAASEGPDFENHVKMSLIPIEYGVITPSFTIPVLVDCNGLIKKPRSTTGWSITDTNVVPKTYTAPTMRAGVLSTSNEVNNSTTNPVVTPIQAPIMPFKRIIQTNASCSFSFCDCTSRQNKALYGHGVYSSDEYCDDWKHFILKHDPDPDDTKRLKDDWKPEVCSCHFPDGKPQRSIILSGQDFGKLYLKTRKEKEELRMKVSKLMDNLRNVFDEEQLETFIHGPDAAPIKAKDWKPRALVKAMRVIQLVQSLETYDQIMEVIEVPMPPPNAIKTAVKSCLTSHEQEVGKIIANGYEVTITTVNGQPQEAEKDGEEEVPTESTAKKRGRRKKKINNPVNTIKTCPITGQVLNPVKVDLQVFTSVFEEYNSVADKKRKGLTVSTTTINLPSDNYDDGQQEVEEEAEDIESEEEDEEVKSKRLKLIAAEKRKERLTQRRGKKVAPKTTPKKKTKKAAASKGRPSKAKGTAAKGTRGGKSTVASTKKGGKSPAAKGRKKVTPKKVSAKKVVAPRKRKADIDAIEDRSLPSPPKLNPHEWRAKFKIHRKY